MFDGIFNKFTETVFCKESSESEKQIKALKELIEQYPDDEKLKRELKLCEIGLQGEKQIEFELKNANIGMYVLHDVNLVYGDLKAQIDYLVITPAYNYFIECKNLIGNITVDSQGNFNREFYYGNRKIKEGMYSPLSQAQRHVEVYKKIWNENHSDIISQLFGKRNLDVWNKSLVVMANSKNILNLKNAPKACKEKVIKSDRLVDYIRMDIMNFPKELLSNKNMMYEQAKRLLTNYNQELDEDYITKYKEKFNLEETDNKEFSLAEESKEELKIDVIEEVKQIETKEVETTVVEDNPEREAIKNKLIKFRKARSTEKGIPAYYVFTNAELEEILDLMPKTLEELQESKVLQKIKVISHRKEIIAVINGE